MEPSTSRPHSKRFIKKLAGVEPNQVLFADLINGLSVLEKSEITNLQNVEIIMVLRILNNLGYVGDDEITQKLIKSPFEENLIFEVSQARGKVLREINKALKETHL